MNETIGQYLREQREAQSMTVRECARRCGVSPAYVSACEIGLNEPSEKLLRAYAKHLRIDTDIVLLNAGRVSKELATALAQRPELVKQIRKTVTGCHLNT